MKYLKYIFLINAIVELIGGLIIMINPFLLLSSTDANIIILNISKLFGIAVFTLGIISYQLYKHEITSFQGAKMIALALMFYQVLATFVFYSLYVNGLTPHIGISVLHLLMAIVSIYLYFKTVGIEEKAD